MTLWQTSGICSQKSYLLGPTTWKFMQRSVWKDIVNLRIKRLNNFSKMQHHAWTTINLKKRKCVSRRIVYSLLTKCSQMSVRIGRPDISWSVNKLARAVTKWTKACDKRLARLISFNHHTSEYRQYCYVGNTAQQCRLGLFQDSDFAGDLEASKSTSGGVLCIFGSHTFVATSWMCKKQTSVSHSLQKLESFPSMQVYAWSFLTKPNQQKFKDQESQETCRGTPHSTWETKFNQARWSWSEKCWSRFV